jgi:arylsulfatase A-like enzyme
MGNFRGLKRDVWEGGHHVPFIIKWPDHITAGSVSDELISQIDIMATLASITQSALPENAAPDSYDFSAVIKGEKYSSPIREATVINTYADKWGIRKGDWLYINSSTGGHREMPEPFKKLTGYTDFNTEGILFNMKEDPEQRNNLYDLYPERVKDLKTLLEGYRKGESSVKHPEIISN